MFIAEAVHSAPTPLEGENRAGRRRPSLRARLGLLALATLGSLGLGEVGVRILDTAIHRAPIVVSHPAAGWANLPSLNKVTVATHGGHFTLSTDGLGRRLTAAPGAVAPPEAPVLLFVGDSFTHGLAANDDETFAWQVARRAPDLRVVNLGVPGYGADQELIQLEAFLAAEPSARVRDVVVLTMENDFLDGQRSLDVWLGRSKPRFSLAGSVLERGSFELSFRDRAMDGSRLFWLLSSKWALYTRPVDPSPGPGVNLVLASLDALSAAAATRGAKVHRFALRRPSGSVVSDSAWADFVQRSGAIDVTDISRAPGAVGYDGGHWSARGHALFATLVHERIRQPPSSNGD